MPVNIYSYLRASIGDKSDAFRAGQKPNTIPTVTENTNATITADGDTTAAQPAKADRDTDTDVPTTIPITPPRVERKADSIKN